MRKIQLSNRVVILALLAGGFMASLPAKAAEELYFPGSDESWESVAPASAGWDSEKLNAALDIAGARKSSGVVILHGGRIMAERYWDSPDASQRYSNMLTGRDVQGRAIEDVASAQKSVVAVVIGIAQERGFLRIDDPVLWIPLD